MRLADHIIASRDTLFDMGGSATSLSKGIERAERFELRDEVVHACIDLLRSKPSSLISALPLCRLPYQSMWVEHRGGLADTHPQGASNNRDPNFAPIPIRQGMLIEAFDDMQSGITSLAWMHRKDQAPPDAHSNISDEQIPEYTISVTPIGVYFDFKSNGNARQLVIENHKRILALLNNPFALEQYMQYWNETYLVDVGDDVRSRFMKARAGWEKFYSNPIEIEASKKIDDHLLPGISPHGANLINMVFETSFRNHVRGVAKLDTRAARILDNWVLDTSGEGTFLLALIALLNSKNRVIEHHSVDLTKVNKSRTKRGRKPFLSYVTTHLVLNKTQQRVQAAGIQSGRLTPGEHRVMGHFKIRKSGIYWWNWFMRGDPTRPVMRREYQVKDDRSE